jgi:hypothetical protein
MNDMKLENNAANKLLLTLDISSLYTNIDITRSEGIPFISIRNIRAC